MRPVSANLSKKADAWSFIAIFTAKDLEAEELDCIWACAITRSSGSSSLMQISFWLQASCRPRPEAPLKALSRLQRA